MTMTSLNEDKSTVVRYPVCYVCGTGKPATNILYMEQTVPGKPFFPFLETHDPPVNAEPAINNKVLACNLCLQLLHLQWKNFEDTKTPYVKRIYWLKRDDSLPYSGVEVGVQSEYASQLFGLPQDTPAGMDERVTATRVIKANVTALSPKQSTSHTNNNYNNNSLLHQTPLMHTRRVSLPMPPVNLPLPDKPSTSIMLPAKVHVSPEPQVEALDLSVDSKREALDLSPDKPKSNKRSHNEDYSPPEVLDLSMPDKNARTEVCYSCGDHFSKGSLVNMYAYKVKDPKYPFFPSLTHHARPSKSHPMESSGCVHGCKPCYEMLCAQWHVFNNKGIEHLIRDYYFGKPAHAITRSGVICHDCNNFVDIPDISITFVLCPEKPYSLDVEKRSLENRFQQKSARLVCNDCLKSRRSVDSSSGASNEIDICETSSPECKRKKRESTTSLSLGNGEMSTSHSPTNGSSRLDVACEAFIPCFLCHHVNGKSNMYWISMTPESASSDGMHFPFLKNMDSSSTSDVVEDNKVLVCSLCFHHLRAQWREFETKNVPVDRRNFSHRAPSVSSSSPRGTPNLSSPSLLSESAGDNVCKLADSNSKEDQMQLSTTIKELEIDVIRNLKSGSTLPALILQNPLKIPTNCYVCGVLTRSGNTYVISSRKHPHSDMFFPFLDAHTPHVKNGSIGNGNYLVCTYCFHTLVYQWQQYQKCNVDYTGMIYDIHNYICYVCSLKTYRKRVHRLKVEKFPFLKEHVRHPLALVLDCGQAVAVCQDCHISMLNQFSDMEKSGVPVEKMKYNWIKKPAPPPPMPQQLLPEQAGNEGQHLLAPPHLPPPHPILAVSVSLPDAQLTLTVSSVADATTNVSAAPKFVAATEAGATTLSSHDSLSSSQYQSRGQLMSSHNHGGSTSPRDASHDTNNISSPMSAITTTAMIMTATTTTSTTSIA